MEKYQDVYKLHSKKLYGVCKYLFRYGVKEITHKGEKQVLVKLTYTPKMETLQQKFGNLPVTYYRLPIENEEELSLLKEAFCDFRFGQKEIEEKMIEQGSSNTQLQILPPPLPSVQEDPQANLGKASSASSSSSSSSSSSVTTARRQVGKRKVVKDMEDNTKKFKNIEASQQSQFLFENECIEIYDDPDLLYLNSQKKFI
ncbi:uncharacterized protein LOC112906310 [Agrilus planipennis]|uniref:Uncharacterized protein LOC112906310 n=1 Tax=Agrilus planipennis TaxID=224129 RepID=A0A7F5RJ46_AGRPL|nr:uncharacterized protein LOC112906310 [Agrilus planipennis]